MKRFFLLLLLFNWLGTTLTGQTNPDWRSKISTELLASYEQGEKMDVLVAFREQADLSPARALKTKLEKAEFVYQQLQQKSE